MAQRRGNTKPQDESTEAPAEATAAPTEAPAEAKADEKPVDLTAFESAVTDALDEADVSTGDVPEASLAAVTAEYRKLEGIKAKNAAKKHVNELMKDRMNSDNLAGARAAMNVSEKALVAAAGGGTKTEKAPADPTENFVQRVATLNLAYNLATSNVPEGVAEDWSTRASELANAQSAGAGEYLNWLKGDPETRGDEPEVSAVVKNAAKLAQGKAAKAGARSSSGGTSNGERHDIGVHIENAFASVEVGTFLSISDIRKTRSDEYGDVQPSAGAISARLFPKSGNSTMEKVGIKPDTQNNKKGAVKVEVASA